MSIDLLAKSALEHDRVKNAAADHGTDIHRRIAAYVGDKYAAYRLNDPIITSLSRLAGRSPVCAHRQ